MNIIEEHFDLKIAIEDKGICERQNVSCDICAMGVMLGYSDIDQLCPCNEVYDQSQKIINEKDVKWILSGKY